MLGLFVAALNDSGIVESFSQQITGISVLIKDSFNERAFLGPTAVITTSTFSIISTSLPGL